MSGHGILIADNLFDACLLSKETTPEIPGLYLKKSLKQRRVADPENYDFFDYNKVKVTDEELGNAIIEAVKEDDSESCPRRPQGTEGQAQRISSTCSGGRPRRACFPLITIGRSISLGLSCMA